METEAIPNKRFQFHDMDVAVHRHTFAREVAFGLTAPQKWLPPKYFYDERGSQLYEQIAPCPSTISTRQNWRFSVPTPLKYMPRLVTWRWLSSAPGMPERPA